MIKCSDINLTRTHIYTGTYVCCYLDLLTTTLRSDKEKLSIKSMFRTKLDRFKLHAPCVDAEFDSNIGGRFPVILFTYVDVNSMVITTKHCVLLMAWAVLGTKQKHRNRWVIPESRFEFTDELSL